MVKLYIGNLPFATTEQDLKEIFSEAGNVEATKVVTDPFDGRSRGFGFVEMADEDGATKAVEKFDGSEIQGRSIRVDRAKIQRSDASKKATS